jgi:O-antigen/teichoic acid export membrane protein
VAPEFIPLLLGDQWTGAVPILQVLCVFAAMRVMTILISPLLVMVGDARFQSVLTFIALLYMPPLFVLGAKYHGPEGVALAWLLGYPPIIIALFYRTARHCGIPIAELLRALYPSLVASAVMLAAVAGCRLIVPADVALPLRLALYILSGMLAYGLTLLLAFRSRVMTFVSFIRQGLAASAKPAPQTVAPVHPSAPPG